MSQNSQFTINNFSPNFRDALLLRNLLADSIKNNSLTSWLDSINKPVSIVNSNGEYVIASPDIEIEGPGYRADNIRFNKINTKDYYKNNTIFFNKVDIVFPDASYSNYSTKPINSPTTDGPIYRDTQNTLLNLYKSGGLEYSRKTDIEYRNTNIVTNTDYINLYAENNSPENTDSDSRRDLSITQNKYKGAPLEYERISLKLLPFELNSGIGTINLSTNTYVPTLTTFTTNNVPANGPFQGGNIRQFNTAKNIYLDVAKQTTVDLSNDVTPTNQYTSYLERVNSIGLGLNLDFDIRGSLTNSSLTGRILGATGVLPDTRIGELGQKYLGQAFAANTLFNIKEETIGRFNTNIASVLAGGDLIAANNRITVGDGFMGAVGNILERITGAKYPVSSLDVEFFSFSNKKYTGIGNIERANRMLENTGSGTVNNLFKNINANTYSGLTGNRLGYAPKYKKGNKETNNSKIYAFSNNDGGVKDFLIQDTNSPIAQSSHDLSGLVDGSGFNQGPNYGIDNIVVASSNPDKKDVSKFIWSDTNSNKLPRVGDELINGKDFKEKNKKSILYKTQELFNSGKMRTLVSGKGTKNAVIFDEISTTKKGFMSKGSAVLKNGGFGVSESSNPDEIFARAWSPVDTYSTYRDLQKHSALIKDGRIDNSVDVESSVLEKFGLVKIAPYKNSSNIKKFMFSIENLAWNDDLDKLLPCEIGTGDLLTNKKGRIMWFPPYDISFNESVSVSLDRANFIGRGEPIHTYNNTERTGTLSWKIIIDHPNYLNFMKDRTDDEISAFFAGALTIPDIREHLLTPEQKNALEVSENKTNTDGIPPQEQPDFEFKVYFPNDVSQVPVDGYEDGLSVDYSLYPNGIEYNKNGTGIKKYYGLGTINGEGIVGTKGKPYIDNTNFGLNGQNNQVSIPDTSLGTISLGGWTEIRGTDLRDYFTNGNCKYCKIEITGYASPQGGSGNEKNQKLAKERAENFKTYFKQTFLTNSDEDDKRITVKSEALTSTGCKAESSVDSIDCKKDRYVSVKVKYDSGLEKDDDPEIASRIDRNEPIKTTRIPLSRFYTECDYFEAVSKDTDSFIYSDLKTKIKNFHPAFHSITPEGFNSRLTFLHQCTRQGPTDSSNADNLAFGRPPVCILRIGDFYHTKIMIESLNIDYEPLVWDLNPEGVGVQPMIANIAISFAFLGGSSMKGPINRLQNGISFNFFANTELYDPRAERIVKRTEPKDGVEYEIQDGKFPFPDYVNKRIEKEVKDAEYALAFANQKAQNEANLKANLSALEEKLAILENDKKILSSIKIANWNNMGSPVGFDLTIQIDKDDDLTKTIVSTEYEGELYIQDGLTKEQVMIGTLVISPVDGSETEMEILGYSWDSNIDDATFNLNQGESLEGKLGLINFKLSNHPNYKKIMEPLEDKICTEFTENVEIIVPCDTPDSMLKMKWKDNDGSEYVTNFYYTKDNNNKFNTI